MKDNYSHPRTSTNAEFYSLRLRQMVEVLGKVERRLGSALLTYAWYRSEPLPGFSGQTAIHLVQSNRADDVLAYIDAADAGIHA